MIDNFPRADTMTCYSYCFCEPCGDYSVATTSRYVEILYFKHFYKHIVFTGQGDKIRNKEIKDYINVSVMIDIEWGDTK